MAQLTDIFRHPIKGLAPESLSSAELIAGQALAGDRQFALAHKTSKYDPANPKWQKRNNFVVVALTPKLATIATSFNDETGVLKVTDAEGAEHSFNLAEADDQMRLGALVEAYGNAAQPGPYTLAKVQSGNLADRNTQTISLHSGASHDEVVKSSGIDISRRRWRGNLWFSGFPAWEEFNWVGKEVSIGSVRLEVTERIERCAATSANTKTGERDINMPSHLFTEYAHRDFGVLCKVLSNGCIQPGDTVQVHG
ncbi:MAG: MOSC N-terminal beta barrel domain-containing protein [Hyphomicrobiales bacterium]